MEETIANLREGNFDAQKGSLDFSCTRLELTLFQGENLEGSFKVYGPKDRLTKGRVYSSEPRMHCLTKEFFGEEEEIGYVFDGEGLEEGEVLKGEFYFISNQGEYYLPFVVSVSYHVLQSSLGVIKNLFHFTNLAKSNWAEAVKLFYSPEFHVVFSGNDKQYYQLYKGLSVYKGNEQNMEEFLLAVNKKQKIEYLLHEEQLRIEDPAQEECYEFLITRNGWGYTELELSCESGLVVLEKRLLTDNDFLGNTCKVRFRLCKERLHRGNNFDRIFLKTTYELLTLPVTVSMHRLYTGGSKRRVHKQLLVQLMEFYQAFRMKKVGTGTWLRETQKLVEQLIALDESDVSSRLFQAQFLLSQERYNEAQWVLDHTEQMMTFSMEEEPVLWAYKMYLTTLCSREETYTDEVTELVEELYKRHGDWRIAWLLLYLSEEYNKSGSKKWLFLEEQFCRGCTSPILYIEALLLLHTNPTLLMRLSDFEIQVLHYAAKKDVLTQEIIEQLQCLAMREKEFSSVLFHILTASYQKKQDKETLMAICSLLMKGGRTQSCYFEWYERAVEEGIRLTRLYDYYMLALDMKKQPVIHKMVLMYFSYHSDLDYERNAYLYADVYRRKEEFPELYLTYLPQIERFVEEQLRRRHINDNLAFLYKHFINGQMVKEEAADALASLLFMHQICVKDASYSKVIVRYQRQKKEAVYLLAEGKAVIPLYGPDCTILFEDTLKHRFAGNDRYTIEKLLLPGKLLNLIEGYATKEVGVNLYLCEDGNESRHIQKENVARFLMLFQSEQVEDNYCRELALELVHFYYEGDYLEELDSFLGALELKGFNGAQRNELLHFLVLRSMYDKAYDYVKAYGTYGIDAKTLVRLLHDRITRFGMEPDETMLYMGSYAFRKGKYDEKVLTYLIRFYHGTTKELRDLWKAASSFDVDTYSLDEKILLQMLYTGSFVGEEMEIFRDYVKGGAKAEVEEAFLSQCGYDYFVREKVMDSYVFEEMLRMMAGGEQLPQVCELAAVQYYAEHKEQRKKEQEPILTRLVRELLLRQIHLPFLRQYGELVPAVALLTDKTMIEYRANPGCRAVIHYVLEKELGEEGEYRTEEMTHVYGGVYFKEFQLFFGERIQYYIMEETEESSQLTESDSIQKSDIEKGFENSRYDLVNNIAIAQTLQDYDTLEELLKEYGRVDYMVQNLFRIR